MIKAVLFDFDETLQDRTAAFEKYMDAFFDEFLPQIDKDEREKRKEEMRITGNGGYVDREKWYQSLIDSWHWSGAPSKTVLAEHYDHTFGDYCVIFKNTVPTLVELKRRGYTVGIVTNGPSYLQNHKMDMSGLRKYCDIVIVSGDIGVHKPDPAIFKYTADKLGLKTCECVYVGDHPVNDIQGALSAKMKTIRMNWGWFKGTDLADDVPTIEDIGGVLSLLP